MWKGSKVLSDYPSSFERLPGCTPPLLGPTLSFLTIPPGKLIHGLRLRLCFKGIV